MLLCYIRHTISQHCIEYVSQNWQQIWFWKCLFLQIFVFHVLLKQATPDEGAVVWETCGVIGRRCENNLRLHRKNMMKCIGPWSQWCDFFCSWYWGFIIMIFVDTQNFSVLSGCTFKDWWFRFGKIHRLAARMHTARMNITINVTLFFFLPQFLCLCSHYIWVAGPK